MASMRNIIRLKDLVGKTDAQIFLIVGPAGSGKESFALQYMIDGFFEKNNGVFLTTDSFPSEIIQNMKSLGTDPTPFLGQKQLKFIDVYSYRTGSTDGNNDLRVKNIRDLTKLSMIINSQIDATDKLRLVINTVSTLAIFNSGVPLLEFMQTQVARLKQKNHSGIIIAHEGIMEEKVIQGIKAFVDGVIQFKLEEDENGVLNRKLRVEFASTINKRGWITF